MRLRLHHLAVEASGHPPALEAARELLGGLPLDAGSGPADLLLALRPSPPRPRPAGPRLCYFGDLDCHADGDGLLLSDGASRVRVAAGGGRVEVEAAPASLAEGHRFAHVLLLVSLVLALRWRSLFHLHAGALAAPDGRAVLVAGGAGAGKSTLTLALLEQGCGYLGDDALFLRAGPAGPECLGLPRAFHVAPRTAAAFPRVALLLDEWLPAGEKRRLDPRRAWPGRERAALGPPALLLLPVVTGRPATEVEPLPAAEALGALLESSALLVVDGLPGAREQLELLRAVADGARAFRLHLGTDLLERPALAAELLRLG